MLATTSAYPDCSSLANFNAWAYWIYQQFIAFGWVDNGDTGSAVQPAVSTPTSPAFNILKSTDALSSTCPVYVKLEMWSSGNVPQIAITVGTGGTDGAGNMHSPVSVRQEFNPYTYQTSQLQNLYASGDAGNIRFLLWTPSGGSGYPVTYELAWIIIGRSYNSSGSQTGDYVMTWFGSYSGKFCQTVYNPTIGGENTQDSSGYMIAALPYPGNNAVMGGTVMVSPVFQNIGGFTNPSPDILVGKWGDFPSDAIAACTVYGTSHNYMPVVYSLQDFINGIESSLLIRFE